MTTPTVDFSDTDMKKKLEGYEFRDGILMYF